MTDPDNQDAYNDAQQAQALRELISGYARGAVQSGGVDRTWVNRRLAALGAPLVTGTSEYRLNTPISAVYGATIAAESRADAVQQFNRKVARLTEVGTINDCHSYGDNVYQISFADPEQVTFYSGPEDVAAENDATEMDLTGLKQAIWRMLKDAVSGHAWSYGYARKQLSAMGLEPLPKMKSVQVQVPVSGTVSLDLSVFEGDDDDVVQQAAAGVMSRAGSVYIKPEEIGTPFTATRPDGMAMEIVDDVDDEDDD